MFRILIVEDIRPTLDQLEKLLQEMIPATEVDGAETVDEARQMLVFRDREGETYDAAIVDFKLPMAPGENPEFDTTICDMVSERMPDALIVHITAYEDQKIVADHIRERHVRRPNLSMCLTKMEVGWPDQLVGRLRSFLYSRAIRQELDDLFGTSDWANGQRGPAAGKARRKPTAHDLPDMMVRIAQCWDVLETPLQDDVKRVFNVKESRRGVRITLA